MTTGQSSGVPSETVLSIQGPTVAGGTPPALAPITLGGERTGDGRIDKFQSGLLADGSILASGGQTAMMVISLMERFNGTGFEKVRVANIVKNVAATVITSETTVWTPAGGKKFRLMGFCLTQGVVTGAITLKDNTAGTTILVIPQNTIGVSSGNVFLGNGILSAVANNVLTATGVSTETITGFFYGTEE